MHNRPHRHSHRLLLRVLNTGQSSRRKLSQSECPASVSLCVLQVFALKKWTRWLLVPWLVMYSVNIIILITIATLMFIYPPRLNQQVDNQMLR